MRIEEHPIIRYEKRRTVRFTFNGREMEGLEGEPIASALYANGVVEFTRSPKHGRPRGLYCAIGKCSSCMMRVDGVPNVRTCITPLREGMVVESQNGYSPPPGEDAADAADILTGGVGGDAGGVAGGRTLPYEMDVDVAVIGAGPAGLAAGIEAARKGVRTVIFDENIVPGGQLIKQTHKFFGSHLEEAGTRGIDIGKELVEDAISSGAEILTEATVFGFYEPNILGVMKDMQIVKVRAQRVIVAAGASENVLVFENNDLPGIYGAGAIQTLVNVHGVHPGGRVLMIGSGNVGLIVTYQLLQAGVPVVGIVEAMPHIGGYLVHASKVRRLGVPIYTGHTIVEALGKDRVEGAVIAELDERWRPKKGTEKRIDCEIICLAVGLRPTVELLYQAGCEMRFIGEMGGHVPYRDDNMETTRKGWYVAGDSSGVEEATAAILEGRIAGRTAAASLTEYTKEDNEMLDGWKKRLEELRAGPTGEKIRKGLSKLSGGVLYG
ncbi:MAG: (2Fe-2S)-binding protein [Thermoplasmata archaeon]|nr:(2Fe-2S)-binding protein [Thermoplasmata archaeon]